jgi:hypothetical protein
MLYTQKLLHIFNTFFTYRSFCTEKLWHRASFYTEKLLYRASFYREQAFTQRSFYTQKCLVDTSSL